MDQVTFAQHFEDMFRETYLHAVRRIADKRGRLTPETIVLLDHLFLSGPLTPTEIAQHLKRAPSSLSEMLEHLLADGLLERDRDPADGRKSLIWLSEAGRAALAQARQVLDPLLIEKSALALTPTERSSFLTLFERLLNQMKGHSS